jgi:hypothetical protein
MRVREAITSEAPLRQWSERADLRALFPRLSLPRAGESSAGWNLSFGQILSRTPFVYPHSGTTAGVVAKAPALVHGGECNDGPQQLQDHCANPVLLCAGAHGRAYILCVPSPFVDTDRATQANFGHKALFLWQIRLAIAAITGRPLNPLGLRPIARKFNLGLVSLLLAVLSELK